MESKIIIFAIISYFLGSIPFAFIVPKIFGIGDIRKVGSGNVGATNVLRTGKKSLAFLVLILDSLKGFLPVFLITNLYINNFEYFFIIIFISSFAILGHIFPIWLKFQGGKGVATYIGFIFSIDYILGLIFLIIWLLIATLSRYSSLSSIVSLILMPFILFIFSYQSNDILLFIAISIIIILKHYSNIKRLISKKETKISF